MHKLVILIEPPQEESTFYQLWPQFLRFAESMPGLLREATSHIDQVLYGDSQYAILHELFFESPADLMNAMSSESGRAAGELLQRMTNGNMTLLTADHKEDSLENIRKYQSQPEDDHE